MQEIKISDLSENDVFVDETYGLLLGVISPPEKNEMVVINIQTKNVEIIQFNEESNINVSIVGKIQ